MLPFEASQPGSIRDLDLVRDWRVGSTPFGLQAGVGWLLADSTLIIYLCCLKSEGS